MLGVARLLSQRGPGIFFMPLFLFAAPLFIVVAISKGLYLLEWYVVGALPGLVALVAIGLAWPLAAIATRSQKLATGLGLLICAGFLGFQWQFLNVLHSRPIAPIRDSVLLTRSDLNPHADENRRILTAAALVAPAVYDPRIRPIKSKEDLLELMQHSRDSGHPLFINQSYTSITRKELPELAALLFDPTQFQHTRVPGIEPMFDRDIFSYLGTHGTP